jgi:hypothetical protein
MANTVTQRTLFGGGKDSLIVKLIHIISDGSEETDLLVYDNSAFINDTSRGTILKVQASGNSCTCRLEWDQTADSPALSFDPAYSKKLCFKDISGIKNPNGAGATGDLLLTTANLDAGDEVSLILYIGQ